MEDEKRAIGILTELLGRREISVEELHRFTRAPIGACVGALALARECRTRERREWIDGCLEVNLKDMSEGFRRVPAETQRR